MNIKHLDCKVKERMDNIFASNFAVVVGDADGADKAIQTYLVECGVRNALVYCSGEKPRNNVGNWPVRKVESEHRPGSRAFFTVKDVEMARDADYGLMIWDAKSTGTLSNIIELLKRKKKSVVFVNKDKEFNVISDVSQLETLIRRMSDDALRKADEKIRLVEKIAGLRHEQSVMFA